MGTPESRSTLQISVELGLDTHQTALAQYRQLNSLALGLLRQFEQRQIPATWAMDPITDSAVTESLLAAAERHEIGLLGDATWLGPQISRTFMSQELARRIDTADSLKTTITSLALRDLALPLHLDLMARHGITVVRAAVPTAAKMSASSAPRPLRFGLHIVPVTASLPVTSTWLAPMFSSLRARQLIRRIAQPGRQSHIVIQAHRLLDVTSPALTALERLWDEIAGYHAQGQLNWETLGQMHNRRVKELQRQPARSVLRPAA